MRERVIEVDRPGALGVRQLRRRPRRRRRVTQCGRVGVDAEPGALALRPITRVAIVHGRRVKQSARHMRRWRRCGRALVCAYSPPVKHCMKHVSPCERDADISAVIMTDGVGVLSVLVVLFIVRFSVNYFMRVDGSKSELFSRAACFTARADESDFVTYCGVTYCGVTY